MNEQERELVSLMIGYQIRNSRRSCALSQAELSHGIGSQSMISLLESGRQLPLPDALSLIADRLKDPVLHQYVQILNTGTWSLADFASTNREVLLEVLLAHRGKWHDVHAKLAVELCDFFYDNRIFRIVYEICQLILNHSSEVIYLSKACFYFGSALLFTHQYEEALGWLVKAENSQQGLDDILRSRLYYNLGYAYTALEHYGLGMWYAKSAADSFHRVHDYERHAKSLGLLGVIQCRLGHFDESKETLHLASDLYDKWGLVGADRARIDISLADVYESLQSFESAKEWSHRAIHSSEAYSDFVTLSAAYRILTLVYVKTSADSDTSMASLNHAISAAEESNDGWSLSHSYLLAVGLYPNLCDKVSAAKRAYDAATASNSPVLRAFSAECLANLMKQTDHEQAESYRIIALQSYRAHLENNTRFSSEFRYLPLS